ncbi:MAG: ABC transporter substrate-binding protein [Desulfobacteraceae bacterium]|nr:ABC transporter substrate-binding protein [Desulfobacteraceae bacterium]
MKKTIIILISLTIFSVFPFKFDASANSDKSSSEIVIVINNWSSQMVLSRIVGSLFNEMGYDVSYAKMEISQQWGALARGIAHVQVEVWEGTMDKMFNKMVEQGRIIDAGAYTATTREEWWYPDYVEEYCPGLPDWKALKKCYKIFAVPETYPKGRYLAGPWEKPEESRIRGLDLNFATIIVKESNELWIELDKAYKEKKPIVLFNWTPNWIDIYYKGKFIEFPEYDPKCDTDPSWGINPYYMYDCGNPKSGWLKKAAWSGINKKWPGSLQALKNVSLDSRMFAQMTALMVVDKMPPEQAAQKWIKDNYKLWESWVPVNFKKRKTDE